MLLWLYILFYLLKGAWKSVWELLRAVSGVVANAMWMLTCIVHTSLCVWGVGMLTGLPINCSGLPGGMRGLVPPSHLRPYLHVLCTNSESDLKKGIALHGAWVRCPPEVPHKPNYINLSHYCWISFTFLWSTLVLFSKAGYWTKWVWNIIHPGKSCISMCKQDLLETQYISNVGLQGSLIYFGQVNIELLWKVFDSILEHKTEEVNRTKRRNKHQQQMITHITVYPLLAL